MYTKSSHSNTHVSLWQFCLRAETIAAFWSQIREHRPAKGMDPPEPHGVLQCLSDRGGVWPQIPHVHTKVCVLLHKTARYVVGPFLKTWAYKTLSHHLCDMQLDITAKQQSVRVKILHVCVLFLNRSSGCNDKEVFLAELRGILE